MAISYSRTLRKGSSGTDVRYMKDCLFKLGMYPSNIKRISNSTFGSDTVIAVKKYQKTHKDVEGNSLSVDGIIGKKSWNAIVRDCATPNKTPQFTRNLKSGMSGEDVWYVKNLLYTNGFYSKNITKIANKSFGSNTVAAVKGFQKKMGLLVDGIVEKNTWAALETISSTPVKITPPSKPVYLTKDSHKNLSQKTIDLLNNAWQGVSSTRISAMKMCVDQAYDAANGSYSKGDLPKCLYIIGANLYNTSLNLFKPTVSYVDTRAKAAPSYFTNGRKDWMKTMLKSVPGICATDCSGMIVGCLRKLKLSKTSFDATANGLAGTGHSRKITKSEMIPGDWVWKDGHIGVYLGAGLVVEAAGGVYGVQISNLNSRKCRDLRDGTLDNMSAWKGYRRPKYY